MHIDEIIFRALLDSHEDDLHAIHTYVRWIKLRRRVNEIFYSNTIMLQYERRRAIRVKYPKFHWIG